MCPLSASPPEMYEHFVTVLWSLTCDLCNSLNEVFSSLVKLYVFLSALRQLNSNPTLTSSYLRKEVIQPHLPIRLPCYDFTPVTTPALDGSLLTVKSPALGIRDSHGVTGGVYKTRERIHRDILIRDY